jgi:hypothetical protein
VTLLYPLLLGFKPLMRDLRVLLKHIELLDDAVPHVGLPHPEDYAHEHIAQQGYEQNSYIIGHSRPMPSQNLQSEKVRDGCGKD